MKLKIKLLVPEAKIPTRGTPKANAYDLSSAEQSTVVIMPGEMISVRTGIAIELPDNYVGDIRPRSGLAFKHRLTVINSPGTIDSDYRGEIKIGLVNHDKTHAVTIQPGERIAQILVHRTEELEFEQVEELSDTVRGEGGFGSTDKRNVSEQIFDAVFNR